VAGNKGPHSHSIAPSPAGVGRRKEKKGKNLVGWANSSLTEQQTKQKKSQ